MPLNPTPGVVTSPSGTLRTSFNYISQYDYAIQYEPNKVLGLHPRYGNGLITGFCKIVGAEKAYNSDQVIHGEQSRLMNFLKDVTVVGNVFTTAAGAAHNIRVNDAIMISGLSFSVKSDLNPKSAKVKLSTKRSINLISLSEPMDSSNETGNRWVCWRSLPCINFILKNTKNQVEKE